MGRVVGEDICFVCCVVEVGSISFVIVFWFRLLWRSLVQWRNDRWNNWQLWSEEVGEFVVIDDVEQGRIERFIGIIGGGEIKIVLVVINRQDDQGVIQRQVRWLG